MEEARRVLARLERIDTLDRDAALPDTLLRELRLLVGEADAWARSERYLPDSALRAVARCHRALEGKSRTLLA
jgi:hypothetical protein